LEAISRHVEQQSTIEQQQTTIDEQQALLKAMQRDIALMKRTLFGRRQERYEAPAQGLLFESLEKGEQERREDNSDADQPDDGEGNGGARSRGRRRRVLPESLPRIQKIHELTDADIPEHLGNIPYRKFLKKVGEYVEWMPPKLTVVEEFVEMLAADNADATETAMVAADRSKRIISCFAGPSLALRCWLVWLSITSLTISRSTAWRRSSNVVGWRLTAVLNVVG